MSTVKPLRTINPPYLLFVGDTPTHSYAKTAAGLRDWVPERCVGQWRFGDGVDLELPDLTPKEAAAAGAKTMVIGAAPAGGQLPPEWIALIVSALDHGLDVASGLHQRLTEIPEVVGVAEKNGRTLHDVRIPPADLPIGTGRRRAGSRILTVGTDCACGKKYTALALTRELARRNVDATFRGTGQTGILISGSGIPIDAVVSDFVAGAAELLSPDADADHWDIIEGQGSIFHPSYAAVTVGLIHGSQPDALVLCHEVGRHHIEDIPSYPTPPLDEAIACYERIAQLTNPMARVVGISLNTHLLSQSEANRHLEETEQRFGLPCVDPMRTGVAPIVNAVLE